jgi:AcrR family transcriptional regulator
MSQSEQTRERLLQATLELISARGYQGATTREIAERAGVSELTLFRKFGKKEILFQEMLHAHTFLPRLKDLIPEVQSLPPAEGLTTIGNRFLETLTERKDLMRIMMSEVTTFPDQVRGIYAQVVDDIAATLEQYLKTLAARGELRDLNLHTVAAGFMRVLFISFMNMEVLRGQVMSRKDKEILVSETVDIFLNGILSEREV